MRLSRFILPVFLPAAISYCCVISLEQPHAGIVGTAATSPGPATASNEAIKGILTNRNFQTVFQAMEQRTGVKRLTEPEVTTVVADGSINRSYYNQTFIFNVTNK